VELLEPLAFVLGHLLEQLCARLEARALATNELRLALSLQQSAISEEDVSCFAFQVSRGDPRETRDGKHETTFTRTLRLPVPMLDSKVFLKLLQLDLKAHPPGAPVAKVTLAAEPVRPRYAQSGLFVPQAPEPERLELTLARIAGVVGEGNVGSAELLDNHRPDAFHIKRFALPPAVSRQPSATPHGHSLALRVFHPPVQIAVDVRSEKPVRIRSERIQGEIVSVSGPWKISGEWWEKSHRGDTEGTEKNNAWIREEWDVAVTSLMAKGDAVGLYRIYRDEEGRWFVHGEYD
jgi:protein ImuB